MRFRDFPAWPFGILALVIAACFLALCMSGCGAAPVPRGSAQDDSIEKQARAKTQRESADADALTAAGLAAQAMLDESAAQATRIPADIERAAQSRAAAIVAKAIADAEEKTATKAESAAEKAKGAASLERAVEAKVADDLAFRSVCRWIALASVVAALVLGGILARLISCTAGVVAGGALAGLGFAILTFGAAAPWLPWAFPVLLLAVIGFWAWTHGRHQKVTVALSHTLDTVEGATASTIADAKAALGKAVARSGLAGWIDRLRAGWSTSTATIVAPELSPMPTPADVPVKP